MLCLNMQKKNLSYSNFNSSVYQGCICGCGSEQDNEKCCKTRKSRLLSLPKTLEIYPTPCMSERHEVTWTEISGGNTNKICGFFSAKMRRDFGIIERTHDIEWTVLTSILATTGNTLPTCMHAHTPIFINVVSTVDSSVPACHSTSVDCVRWQCPCERWSQRREFHCRWQNAAKSVAPPKANTKKPDEVNDSHAKHNRRCVH